MMAAGNEQKGDMKSGSMRKVARMTVKKVITELRSDDRTPGGKVV